MTTQPTSGALTIASFRPQVAAQDYYVGKNPATGREEIHYDPSISWSSSVLNITTVSPQVGTYSWGGLTQFSITPHMCTRIEHAVLAVTLSETGGSSTVTPTLSPFFINNLQFCPNGAAITVLRMLPDAIYWYLQNYNLDELNGLLAGNNMNITSSSAFTEGAAIAAGGSKTYMIPIPIGLLAKLPVEFISAPFNVNVYWSATAPVASGSGTLALTSAQLILHNRSDPATKLRLSKLIAKDPFIMGYNLPIQQDYVYSLAAGSTANILLPGIIGAFSSIDVAIIASTAYASGAYRTYAALSGASSTETTASLDLQDVNHVSYLGTSGAYTAAMARFILPALHSKGTALSIATPLYHLYATSTPSSDLNPQKGTYNGNFLLDGTQVLVLNPSGTFSSGTYTVRVVFWRHAQVRMGSDGVILQDY
jgi:hypothetical protein